MSTIISWPNLVLGATITGDGFQTTTPLANLKNPQLGKVVRSIDSSGDKVIYIDLGAAATVQTLCIFNHNLSFTGDDTQGRVRFQGYSDASYTTAVSGADTEICYVWPYNSMSAREAAEYPNNFITTLPASVIARYWKVILRDDANADGYLEFGIIWIGENRFAPEIGGPIFGMSLGYESRDVIENDNPAYGEKRTPRRSQVMTFSVLTADEKRQALIMQKTLTQVDEALFITDSAAAYKDLILESYPCFIRKADPLTYPYVNNNQMGLEIIERTA